MKKEQRAALAAEIIVRLKQEYPKSRIALEFSNPLELLVSTILSAQCTDVMVNKVTATLFQRYTTVDDFADADPRAFQKAIRPTGFFRNKTRNIIAAAGMIRDEFQGRIPNRMEDILRLPGVARKTANIVLGNAYGVVEGIAVDTHVLRLAPRLGLSRNTLPDKVEKDLMSLVPRTDWFVFSYLLIDHGRKTCKAQRPRCPECVLFDICPSAARSVKVLRKKR